MPTPHTRKIYWKEIWCNYSAPLLNTKLKLLGSHSMFEKQPNKQGRAQTGSYDDPFLHVVLSRNTVP